MLHIRPTLAVLSLSCAAFLNCANTASQPDEKPAAAGTGVVAPAIKVATSANGVLGHVLSADDHEVTILTNSGWIVDLDFNGAVDVDTIRFQYSGCTGTAYVVGPSSPLYGKSLYSDGVNYYKPASSPNNSTV